MEQAEPNQLDLSEGNAHVSAVRTDAIRHDRRLFTLDPREHGAEDQQHRDRIGDVDNRDHQVLDHAFTGTAASAANSASAWATVAFFAKHGSKLLTTPSKFV